MTSGKANRQQAKPFLILGAIILALLASPVLADYLGPNRTVSTWVWQRSTCNYLAAIPGGSCTLTLYSPPHNCASPSSVAGYFGPGPSACGSSWPGNCGSGLSCSISLTGDSVGGCSSGETGCTSTEQTSTYPPATVSGSVSCSGAVTNGWCTGSAQLVLTASEPVSGQSITLIEGTRNGVTFACPGAACSVPLSDGQNDFTFWALSTWGDSSTMGNASGKLDSQPPQVSLGGAGSFCPECGQSLNVTLSVSDAASGVSSWSLALDGALITSGSGASSQTISIPAAGLSAGTHTLLLYASDVSGQANSSSLPFTVLLPTPIPTATPIPNTDPASGGGQPAGPASGNASQPLLGTPTAEGTSTPAAEATPDRSEVVVVISQNDNEPEGERVATNQNQPTGMTPEQTGNVLWGASATAAIAAATAYVLAEQRKRKEEEARARAEAERLNNEARAHEKGYDSYAAMLEAQAQAAFDAQWSQALADPKNHKMKQEPVDPALLAYLRTGKNPPPGYADMTATERLVLYKQTQQYQNYQASLVNWENEKKQYQAWLHSGENPPPGMEDVTEAERLAMYQQTPEYLAYQASLVAWEDLQQSQPSWWQRTWDWVTQKWETAKNKFNKLAESAAETVTVISATVDNYFRTASETSEKKRIYESNADQSMHIPTAQLQWDPSWPPLHSFIQNQLILTNGTEKVECVTTTAVDIRNIMNYYLATLTGKPPLPDLILQDYINTTDLDPDALLSVRFPTDQLPIYLPKWLSIFRVDTTNPLSIAGWMHPRFQLLGALDQFSQEFDIYYKASFDVRQTSYNTLDDIANELEQGHPVIVSGMWPANPLRDSDAVINFGGTPHTMGSVVEINANTKKITIMNTDGEFIYMEVDEFLGFWGQQSAYSWGPSLYTLPNTMTVIIPDSLPSASANILTDTPSALPSNTAIPSVSNDISVTPSTNPSSTSTDIILSGDKQIVE